MRSRDVRRDRTVVDDAPAARRLRLHDADGLLRAQKSAGEVHGNHRTPLFERQIFHGHGRRAFTGVVEEQVEAAEFAFHAREQRFDGFRIADIRGNREHLSALGRGERGGGFEFRGAASGQRHGVSSGLQG